MAISFTLNSSSSGGLTNSITLPATVSAGDLLIAAQYDITSETIPSTPTGWTLINSITSGAAPGKLGIIAKIADGTEGGTTVTWFTGSDNMYAALSLTPDTPLTSLGSVTGTDAISGLPALSLTATPSAGTLPLMLVYAGGSNNAVGNLNVSPDGDFNERVTSPDGLELNATFYDVGDSTTNVTLTTGDTGRQTLAVGNLNLNFAVSVVVDVTGVTGTGQVGSATVTGGSSATATGSEGTGQVGSVTVTGTASVTATGSAATGEVGTPSISGNSTTDTTGSAGTGQVGSVVAAAGAAVSVTGVEATGAVGSVTVTGSAVVSVTGSTATGEVSSVAVTQDVSVDLTGSEAVGQVGEVFLFVEGVSATGQVGSVAVAVGTGVSVSITGLSASGLVGSVAVAANANAPVTGAAGTGAVGSVTVQTGNTAVVLTGVSASGLIGSVIVWGRIVPNPETSYTGITPSPGTSYSQISPAPGASYSAIAPSPETSYTDIDPSPGTSWEEFAA